VKPNNRLGGNAGLPLPSPPQQSCPAYTHFIPRILTLGCSIKLKQSTFLPHSVEKTLILTEKLGLKFIPNWAWSDPDPKLFIPDPDPSKSSGSDRIRIHNTAFNKELFFFILLDLRCGHTFMG
jgi:hypothetical protein